jgi:uncharacterized protein (DUF58 family)
VRLTTDRATLRTVIVVDASASMAFPLPGLAKWVRAREVAIGLAAVAHAEGDPVGLTIAGLSPYALMPKARRSTIVEMIRALDATEPAGSTPLAPLLGAARAPRIAVVSDMLGDAEALLGAARLRVAAGGEVTIVHLVAPEELDPPGDALLAVDPEEPAMRRTLDDDTRGQYRRAFAAWLEETGGAFRAAGVRYLRAETSEPAAHLVRRIAGASGARGA